MDRRLIFCAVLAPLLLGTVNCAELVGGGIACRSRADLHDMWAYMSNGDAGSFMKLCREQRCRYPLCEGESATILGRYSSDETVRFGQNAEIWWTYDEMIRD